MRSYPRKIRKKRGTRTIGYGTVGQHRKTGQRAGRGKTTQWKKSKKSYYLKQKRQPEIRLSLLYIMYMVCNY